MTTPAIRNTLSGRVHLDSGRRRWFTRRLVAGVAFGICGRDVEHWEPATWEQADTKHRCRVCGKRGPIEGATEQGPIEEEA